MDGELAIRHIEAGGRPEDFRRPDRLTSLPDQCTDIAIDLLCEGRGVERLTLNTIARQANYTPSQFHGKVGGKAGMLEMIVGCFAERWTLMTTNPYVESPPLCWLPYTTDGLDAVRCWHAMVELAHSEARAGRPGASHLIADAVRTELDFIAYRLALRHQRRATMTEILATAAAAQGLRAALAAPTNAMPLADAHQTLVWLVESFGKPPNSGVPGQELGRE